MISFKEFLTEGYKNLFDPSEKEKYSKEAYAQLQKSYEKVGGLQGNGFSSPEDLVKNIPFWKLKLSPDGKILAGVYYRDKNGRKLVAISSDGSVAGKRAVADIMLAELTQDRAYSELSAAALKFLVSRAGVEEVKKNAIPVEKFAEISHDELRAPPEDDPELKLHPQLKDFFYQRMIGGEWHTKIALGKPGKTIKKKS